MTLSQLCPACQNHNTSIFLRIPTAPVFCNQLCSTPEEAKVAPTGAIHLAFCQDCGHVFNAAFDPQKVNYSDIDYENSLHFSSHFQNYASELVRDLIDRYHLYGKTIVEIGCGRGDFLQALSQQGDNRGFGFDPAFPQKEATHLPPNVSISTELYSPKQASLQTDLFCARHCLEHIHDPLSFLEMIRSNADPAWQANLFFEVPNVLFTLQDGGIWDLIYEHCAYFSPASFYHLFTHAGFQVSDIQQVYGGQFLTLYADAYSPSPSTPSSPPQPTPQQMKPLVQNFAQEYQQKIEQWNAQLHRYQNQGKKVVAWGAGSKGTTFLNFVEAADTIPYIVDINPRKEGKFVPGRGAQIVPPSLLQNTTPDLVVVMNPLYKKEISQTLQQLGVQTELLFA